MNWLEKIRRSPVLHGGIMAALLLQLSMYWGADSYHTYMVLLICVYSIAALGLNIPAGMLGQLSLGHGAAFGLGAYVGAILSLDHGLPVLVSMPTAALVGGVLGMIMAAPAARLGVIALAIVSLGFTLVMQQLIIVFRSITGGADGRFGINAPVFFGQPDMTPTQLATLIIGLLFVTYCAHSYFRTSSAGRTLIALRDNEIGASAIGITPYKWIVIAYSLGSAIGALAGSCYAFLSVSVSPESFGTHLSVLFLLMVIAGGAGTRFGPLVGACIVGLIPILLSEYPNVQPFLYGGLLILIVRLMPRGIMRRSGAPVLGKAYAIDPPTQSGAGVFIGTPTRAHSPVVLKVEGIERRFTGLVAVQDFSFDLRAGEVLALIGPNGSGKTTVLNVICGIYPPQAGRVSLLGRQIAGLSLPRISRAGISRTFQVPRLFRGLTIRETLALALQYRKTGTTIHNLQIVLEFLAEAGLREESFEREVGELPHGQLRMIEIAMAALRGADVLLLDECAAGLSAHEMDLMLRLLRRLAAQGVAMIIVEHHLDLVRAIANTVHVLNLGSLLWAGGPDDLDKSEQVREAYLGSL